MRIVNYSKYIISVSIAKQKIVAIFQMKTVLI